MVLAVGDDTMMGAIEQTLNTYDEPTSFEREMNSISWLLIRLMLVMVPIVFFSNGLWKSRGREGGYAYDTRMAVAGSYLEDYKSP